MPYKVEQSSGKWVCVNLQSGKVMGRHDSKAEAEAQMRAIYANSKGK